MNVMERPRKIKPVARILSFAEAEEADDLFWANKSIAERLEEAQRLRKIIWGYRLGTYPEKVERVVKIISKKAYFKFSPVVMKPVNEKS